MDLTPRLQAQEAYEQKNGIAQEILRNARNELYLSMRFLDLALSALRLVPDPGTAFLSTGFGFVTARMACWGGIFRVACSSTVRIFMWCCIVCLRI